MTEEELPLCECGCGEPVAKLGNRFIFNHHRRGVKASPETKTKISIGVSKALKGIPKSPAHNAAVSKAKTGILWTEAQKTILLKMRKEHPELYDEANENMRGGNDICDHHYIYDHSDLSKYTMKMTRSRHQRLHWLMRKSNIKVPHINEADNGI